MVDCVLLFLIIDANEKRRREHEVQIHLLRTDDTLDRLAEKQWQDTLTQPQSRWIDDGKHERNIRYDALLQQIEEACHLPVGNGSRRKVQRLGDITESSQGIIPYRTKAQGDANLYIKPEIEAPRHESEWKPLLDSDSYIGRYELRWALHKPYLKYGPWLQRGRETEYFDSPKLLVQAMRNRSLTRRLVATYDDAQFYNRHNYNNIILSKNKPYSLKYILALFNSALLNYWYASRFANVNINPSYFRQLPIYPADTETQNSFVTLVDQILAQKQKLNDFRSIGYRIENRENIGVPCDVLLDELRGRGDIVQP